MWDFDYGKLRRSYQVDYTLPSACAEMLRAGLADIGIIPVAAYATIPRLAVIPKIAIAARGPVRSILLISKRPLEQLRTVAVDTSSRTSVALLRVLLQKFHRLTPEFIPREPNLKAMLKDCDAALLIGDPALLAKPLPGHLVLDLGAEWKRLTGKSFVFAFWAVRDGCGATEETVADFQRSRDHGLEPESMARLAREWSVRLKIDAGEISAYLTKNVHYSLDLDCLKGLRLFYEYAAECGALPPAPEIKFL